jgi:lysyl-tRNA synthetase class 1
MATPPVSPPPERRAPAADSDWVNRVADDVIARVNATKGPDAPIVCASGISPSGPVHLGNLRELMTTHLVAEELRARFSGTGRVVTHLHSWDDFDRLRKVPVGVPESYAEHIGAPIGEIPDPFGEHDSYASHFRAPVEAACAALGVTCRFVRQSREYRRGAYRDGMRKALAARGEIFDILEQYRTGSLHPKPVEERRAAFWPLQVYCRVCNHDSTTVHGWDPATDVVSYRCERCKVDAQFSLNDADIPAKLPWKVDWPMRWALEGVDFEPGGEDHSTPGGSFTVGTEIVAKIYDGRAPHYIGYAFVGMAGRTKISSSTGTEATPEFALRFIEPALLRHLYIRRLPGTKFTIDFGADIWRQYDEFDALQRKVATDKATPAERQALARSMRTSAGDVARPEVLVPFRLLWTSADMTYGNRDQVLRIVHAHLEEPPPIDVLEAGIQPRLDCAIGWVQHCLAEDERLHVRPAFDAEVWATLDDEIQRGLQLLVAKQADDWTLAGLTNLVYGVPKILLGLPMDTEATPELKAYQRRFFTAIYQLALGVETGPRLPTLFLSLGQDRVRALLGGPV